MVAASRFRVAQLQIAHRPVRLPNNLHRQRCAIYVRMGSALTHAILTLIAQIRIRLGALRPQPNNDAHQAPTLDAIAKHAVQELREYVIAYQQLPALQVLTAIQTNVLVEHAR